MANEQIRHAAHSNGVKLWQIAARWGCNDANFSRKLRREFLPSDMSRALGIIEELRKENEAHAAHENDKANS